MNTAIVVDRNTIIFPTNVYHPDEIIELVNGEMATAVQTDNEHQIENDSIPTNTTSIENIFYSKDLIEMPCAGYLCSYKSY
jgi:hypothetical protein